MGKGMEKKGFPQAKKKQIKNNRTHTFVLVFLLTLVLVLGTGLAFMLIYSRHSGREAMTQETGSKSVLSKAEPESIDAEIPDSDSNISDAISAVPKTDEGKKGRYGQILSDPEYMEANNIYEKQNKEAGIVSLGFAGDILFDDEYAIMASLLLRGGAIDRGISETLLEKMRNVDIMMLNNEFPYTDRGEPTEDKTYTFRADTSAVKYLEDMGVDIVSIANNHIYDFGEIGLLDTLDTLKEASMPYVGAGRNLKEACAPAYFISGDMKIAFVSATQIERLENPDTKEATETSAGVFRCLYPKKLYETVAEAKENSDFVVVYIHWGTENVEEPDWIQLEQAPALAEAGADLIIGDHPHCLQGIQYFGDTPVIYSLGNFFFNSRTMDTCMLKVDISMEGIQSIQFLPAIQSDCRTDLAYGEEKERIISYMNSISYDIAIDAEGYVTRG